VGFSSLPACLPAGRVGRDRYRLLNHSPGPLAVNIPAHDRFIINYKLQLNMRFNLALCFLLLSTLLIGQKTKLIKDKETHEVYSILKSNSNKHGDYQKFGTYNNLLIKGYYNNGIKDSIWEYYNSVGLLIQKYDYTSHGLIYYKITDSEKDIWYKLINGADNPYVILDRPPIFLGGLEALAQEIIPNIQYPEEAYKNGISGRVFVTFIINKDGETGSFSIQKPLGYGLDNEAIRVLKLLSKNWIPGIYNGQPVDIEYTYPVTFRIF
jgi:TonB family protein